MPQQPIKQIEIQDSSLVDSSQKPGPDDQGPKELIETEQLMKEREMHKEQVRKLRKENEALQQKSDKYFKLVKDVYKYKSGGVDLEADF